MKTLQHIFLQPQKYLDIILLKIDSWHVHQVTLSLGVLGF